MPALLPALAAATFQFPSFGCAALAELPVACADTPRGVVVSDDPVLAERYASVLNAGEARFQRHFRRTPTAYALIIGEALNPVSDAGLSGAASAELQSALRAAGARHVLPWFTPEQMARLDAASRRRDAEVAALAEGLSGTALEDAVERRLAEAGAPPAAQLGKESATAHEFGHMWAIAAFWPDHARAAGDHYGGPAADWFDETAAVLMEDEAMAESRRDAFGRALADPLGARPKRLADYFIEPHPMAGLARGLAAGQLSGESRMVTRLPPGELRRPDGHVVRTEDIPAGEPFLVVRPDAPSGPGARPTVQTLSVSASRAVADPRMRAEVLMFYAQARVLADFLIDRSGDEDVFADIAEALAAGRTIDDWLAAEGARRGLGGSVAELEEQWAAWLGSRYPGAD